MFSCNLSRFLAMAANGRLQVHIIRLLPMFFWQVVSSRRASAH